MGQDCTEPEGQHRHRHRPPRLMRKAARQRKLKSDWTWITRPVKRRRRNTRRRKRKRKRKRIRKRRRIRRTRRTERKKRRRRKGMPLMGQDRTRIQRFRRMRKR